MKFDYTKTLEVVIGGLTKPSETWNAYLSENRPWLFTLVNVTAPLLVASVLLSLVLSRWFGTFSAYSMGGNWFLALIHGLLMAAIGFAIAVFVFNILAGVFKGTSDFSRAFAALTLVAIPAWAAGVAGAAIPWVGGLVTFAGAIVSLVFLYRIIPLALGVPDDKRVVHFVSSLIAVIIINIVVGAMLRIGGIAPDHPHEALRTPLGSESRSGGMFGEMQRQAELMARATEQTYDPPGDGEVSSAQIRWVEDVLEKSQAVVDEEMEKLKRLSEEAESDKVRSANDVARMYQGMGSVVNLSNIEMETVLSTGGNWAEYQWIRDQLRQARLNRGEGPPPIPHNFELWESIDERLRQRL